MAKWTRWVRWGFWIVALVVGGVMSYRMLIRLSNKEPDYAGQARAEGVPVVRAVYAYRARTNLWPEFLEDTGPELARGTNEWAYTPGAEGGYVYKGVKYHGTALRYDFSSAVRGWKLVRPNGAYDTLEVAQDVPGPTTLPAERVIENMLGELDKRIAREPMVLEHYRLKASVLRALGREEAARTTVRAAFVQLPDQAWPRLALASLPGAQTRAAEAEVAGPATDSAPATMAATAPANAVEAFLAWVPAHASFMNYYYLAVFQAGRGQQAEAMAALEKAAGFPLEITGEETERADYFAFDAARMALRAGAFDLVLKLTDKWEKLGTEKSPAEASYLALRAAAWLAKGQPGPAGKAIAEAQERNQEHPLYAKDLAGLAAAVKKGEAAYRYDPGDHPAAYAVFEAVELPGVATRP